jgi:hypothetical protein
MAPTFWKENARVAGRRGILDELGKHSDNELRQREKRNKKEGDMGWPEDGTC